MAIWTANLKPQDLTRGFKSGKDLAAAVAELEQGVPLGAVDLRKALTEPLASFEVKASRRRVVLYLGDGKSVRQPLDARRPRRPVPGHGQEAGRLLQPSRWASAPTPRTCTA